MKFPTARHPLTDATEQTENVSDVSENHHTTYHTTQQPNTFHHTTTPHHTVYKTLLSYRCGKVESENCGEVSFQPCDNDLV